MEKEGYKPRLLIIMVMALVIGQILIINYMKSDFEQQISQVHEAVNMNSLMQGALVNMLVEKKIIERNDLLNEAQKLSKDLKVMVDKMKDIEKQYKATQDKDSREAGGSSKEKTW